jgi:peptide-methionine (S)-S-oxide reductase
MGDHTETLQVDFDPSVLSFAELAERFWAEHDPTERPYGSQYRAALFYADAAQQEVALALGQRRANACGGPLRTAIEPLGAFTRAEDYHQKYYLRGRAEWMAAFAGYDARAFTDSTAAARLNALAGGHGSLEDLEAERASLGLEAATWERLREGVRAQHARRRFLRLG